MPHVPASRGTRGTVSAALAAWRQDVPTAAQFRSQRGTDARIFPLDTVLPEWRQAASVAVAKLLADHGVAPLMNVPEHRFVVGLTYIMVDLRAVMEWLGAKEGEETPAMFYAGATRRARWLTYTGSGSDITDRQRTRPAHEFMRLVVKAYPKLPEGRSASYRAVKSAEEALLARLRVLRGGWFMNRTKRSLGIDTNRGKSRWTLEMCLASAKPHETRKAWITAERGAYKAAARAGWRDLCCAHMRPTSEVKKAANQIKAQSPEWRAKMEARSQSPEWRANNKASKQRLAQSPEWRANNKASKQRLAQSPEWRAKMEAVTQSPEWRANNKASKQRMAQSPEWRAKMEAVTQSPEWRAKMEAVTQSPEWRANTKAANQRLAQSPEWRANTKAANQRKAQNPEWRERLSAAGSLLPLLPLLPPHLRTKQSRDLLASAMLAVGRDVVKAAVLAQPPQTMDALMQLLGGLAPPVAMAAE